MYEGYRPPEMTLTERLVQIVLYLAFAAMVGGVLSGVSWLGETGPLF